VDLNEVVAGVQQNLASTIAESGAVISGSELPVLPGDAVPFTHLFQNLISNALKYRSERPPRI
jgi:light-regulated signal transduction histidine kinase (bacteriophytochrome)